MIFKSSFRQSVFSIICVAIATLSACSAPFLQEKKAGTVMVSITVPGSGSETTARFIHPDTKKIIVSVTGAGMEAVTSNADVPASGNTATVELTNIPSGADRTIKATLYDLNGAILAEGSVVMDIAGGSVNNVGITAKPINATTMTLGNQVNIPTGSQGQTFMYSIEIPAADDYLATPSLDSSSLHIIPTICNPNGSAIATTPDPSKNNTYTFSATAAGTYFAIFTVPAAWTGPVTFTMQLSRAITSFDFTTPSATGTINEVTHTITVSVPFDADLTSLTPTIVHTGYSISPASLTACNFLDPVVYTVTSADLKTRQYTVKVETIGKNVIKGVHLANMNHDYLMGYVFIDSTHKLYSQESGDTGTTWAPPECIDNTGTTVDFAADIDGAGRIFVTWINSPTLDPLGINSNARYEYKTSSGDAWTTPNPLVTSSQIMCPSVFRNGSNFLFNVGYNSNLSGPGGVKATGFHWNSSTLVYTQINPVLNLAADTAATQQIYGDSSGNLHLLYVRAIGSDSAIYEVSGSSWTFPAINTETSLVNFTANIASQPYCIDFNSQKVLMYTLNDNTLYYRHATSFTGLSTKYLVSGATNVALPVYSLSRTRTAYLIADTTNTTLLFVWQGTDGKIYWSKLDTSWTLTTPVAINTTGMTLDGVSWCTGGVFYISGHTAGMGRVIKVTP